MKTNRISRNWLLWGVAGLIFASFVFALTSDSPAQPTKKDPKAKTDAKTEKKSKKEAKDEQNKNNDKHNEQIKRYEQTKKEETSESTSGKKESTKGKRETVKVNPDWSKTAHELIAGKGDTNRNAAVNYLLHNLGEEIKQ